MPGSSDDRHYRRRRHYHGHLATCTFTPPTRTQQPVPGQRSAGQRGLRPRRAQHDRRHANRHRTPARRPERRIRLGEQEYCRSPTAQFVGGGYVDGRVRMRHPHQRRRLGVYDNGFIGGLDGTAVTVCGGGTLNINNGQWGARVGTMGGTLGTLWKPMSAAAVRSSLRRLLPAASTRAGLRGKPGGPQHLHADDVRKLGQLD